MSAAPPRLRVTAASGLPSGARPVAPLAPVLPSLFTFVGRPLAAHGRKWVPLLLMVLWVFLLQKPRINFLNMFCLATAALMMLVDELA